MNFPALRLMARQRGVSLMELMLAAATGLVLSLGIMVIVGSTSLSFKNQSEFAGIQENGTAALRALTDDLRLAGFYALASRASAFASDAASLNEGGLAAIANDCGAAVNGVPWSLNLAEPLRIYDNLNAGNVNGVLPCINGNDFSNANTTAVVIRGAFGNEITDSNGDGSLLEDLTAAAGYANTVYVQASPNQDPNTIVFLGANYDAIKAARHHRSLPNGADAPIMEYQSRLYFLRPCSRPANGTNCSADGSDDGGRPIPTLARQELAGAAVQLVPVAEGIERVQLLFGVDTQSATGEVQSDGTPMPDGIADQYVALPADWSRVVTARISVLVRAIAPSQGYSDAGRVYDLGGGVTFQCTANVDCQYRRHVFTQTTTLRNCAQRRGWKQAC